MILWYFNHKPGGLIWAIFFTVRNTNFTKLNTNLTERFSNKVSDCNFLTYGRSETVVIGIWDNSTLNTPYKQAVTGFGNGFMIGMSLGIEWSIQIAFAVSDTNIFVRSYTLAGIGWTGWRTI